MLFRCRRCLYPNTKPDLHFNAEGVCSACQAYDAREKIDWKAKEREFVDLVKSNPGKTHDVIVACSGGKDSTWQIVKCLELGLRPLAVTATTDYLTPIGRKNLDNISNLCDHVEITVNKKTRNKIAAFALREVGDISWCEHNLIWSIPAREAVAREIPIVLYGEAQNNEYGAGAKGTENISRLDKKWIDEYGGFLGLRVSDVAEILDIEARHMELYRYPDGNVKALFMGAFFPWDGYQNAIVAEANGFTQYHEDVTGSIGRYENLDNYQTGIHDHIRFLKFGYTRADDITSSHIRRGRMTRDEGIEKAVAARKDMGRRYLDLGYDAILWPLGITITKYHEICDRFTNKEVLDWASRPESYRYYSPTITDALKERGLTPAAA